MLKTLIVAAALLAAVPAAAQSKKNVERKMVVHDITVVADTIYRGTLALAIDSGTVTGKLQIMTPTEILGDVAGTAERGVLSLAFPYTMPQRNCGGTAKVNITLPPKPGPAKGTVEAVGCGRDATNKLTGTVEMTPRQPKTKK